MSKQEKNLAILGFIIIMVISAIAGKIYGMEKQKWVAMVDNDPMVTVATGLRITCTDCGTEISNNWILHRILRSQEKFLPAPRDEGRKLCPACEKKNKGPQFTSWEPNPKKSENEKRK